MASEQPRVLLRKGLGRAEVITLNSRRHRIRAVTWKTPREETVGGY